MSREFDELFLELTGGMPLTWQQATLRLGMRLPWCRRPPAGEPRTVVERPCRGRGAAKGIEMGALWRGRMALGLALHGDLTAAHGRHRRARIIAGLDLRPHRGLPSPGVAG